MFYLVFNEMNEEIGFYLIQIYEDDPQDFTVVTALKIRLELDNVSMYISTGTGKQG